MKTPTGCAVIEHGTEAEAIFTGRVLTEDGWVPWLFQRIRIGESGLTTYNSIGPAPGWERFGPYAVEDDAN